MFVLRSHNAYRQEFLFFFCFQFLLHDMTNNASYDIEIRHTQCYIYLFGGGA